MSMPGNIDIAPGETRDAQLRQALNSLHRWLQEGAEICQNGRTDAKAVGNDEVAGLFARVESACEHMLADAKALLGHASQSTGRDRLMENSMESFPASDPPATY